MSLNYWLTLKLKSDTLLGRGDGIAGMLNAEVQHDDYGLPYLSGKTLKGLLTASCGEIMFALQQCGQEADWLVPAQHLFGGPGGIELDARSWLHVGDAVLPGDLRAAIIDDIEQSKKKTPTERITRQTILDSLTTLRRQTAMNPQTGAPLKEALRTSRVIIRGLEFSAHLLFLQKPTEREIQLLAACIKGLRRVGTNRNRGLGCVVCELYDMEPISEKARPITAAHFNHFEKEVLR